MKRSVCSLVRAGIAAGAWLVAALVPMAEAVARATGRTAFIAALVILGFGSLAVVDLRAQRTDTPAGRHRDRVNRAVEAAKQGRLLDAEAIIIEDLPGQVGGPERSAAYASRVAVLVGALQNIDRFEEAKLLGEVALEACSAYLQTKPEVHDPRKAARYLALTGFLFKRVIGDLDQAREAYLLAYKLDPERQIESLRQVQALEERERVIQERREHAAREKGVRP